MATPTPREFGKRKPVKPGADQAATPVKRSGHVALLLMGTFAVGGGAYALMPRDNCEPKSPGMAAPSSPQTGAGCPPRIFQRRSRRIGRLVVAPQFLWAILVEHSSSGTASEAGVTRGGFGSFARAFAGHFSGG